MANITAINFGKSNGLFIEKPTNLEVNKISENRCLTIRLSKDYIDLIFDSESDLVHFCAGAMSFYTYNFIEKEDEGYIYC